MKLSGGEISEVWGKDKIKNLFTPVDNATIVLFRIMFGGILFWEVTRYFKYDWIARYWIDPYYNFTYTPFNLQPLPGDGMIYLWYALGLLSICILFGAFYRVSIVLFFLLFTYTFLLEQARYLNHFYLVCLVSFIMMFIPAHRNFSIDAWFSQKVKSNYNPAWQLWLIRFTIGVPYFFGGIAKINPDWLRGYPLHNWLLDDSDFPIIGKYFTEDWMILIMSYSGLILDLAVVPVLLFKKTRVWGFIVICSFHLMNDQLFSIGIFPWFMIAATTLYFAPDWPKKVLNYILPRQEVQELPAPSEFQYHKKTVIALAIFVSILILTPFRHLLIKGNVHWSEEGHKYSWHMKLRGKYGTTEFLIRNKFDGEVVKLNKDGYLYGWQDSKMEGNPIMIWKFVQFMKKEFELMGEDVEIYVEAQASLNGREYEYIIDPNIDLTSVKMKFFGHNEWILPSTVPLSKQR